MNRIALLFPELLLLIVPLLFVYFWRGRSPGLGGLVRMVILAILAVVAAVPLAPLGGRGVDVVIVADLLKQREWAVGVWLGRSRTGISRNGYPKLEDQPTSFSDSLRACLDSASVRAASQTSPEIPAAAQR